MGVPCRVMLFHNICSMLGASNLNVLLSFWGCLSTYQCSGYEVNNAIRVHAVILHHAASSHAITGCTIQVSFMGENFHKL